MKMRRITKKKTSLRIAIIAHYPAASVLPERHIKKRVLKKAILQHPAPWVRALCRELSCKENIEIEVFSHSRHISQVHSAEKEGVKYTFIPKYEPIRCDPYHLYFPAMLQLFPIIKRFDPDIVHGFGTESVYGLLAVGQKKPSVVFIQGIQELYAPFYEMPKIKIAIRKYLERLVVNKVNGFVAETNFALKWAKSMRSNVNVKVIPHAYTKTFFDVRPEFKTTSIYCIGTLSKRKGCTTVLEAFTSGTRRNPKLFNKAELVFVGNGPLKETIERRSKENGIFDRIQIKTNVTHKLMPSEIEKACMMVIGSLVDTSPNVVTEAHAAGIPVIGTSSGGIPEMIEDGQDGFIVPTNDEEAMSLKMETLLGDMQLCKKMGKKGREKVKILNNPSRIADEHIAYYNEILSRGSK